MQEARISNLEEWQKYVVVVFDEMKVKEGIVYNKHTCEVTGFVNVGDVNNELLAFEREVLEEETVPHIATYILVFMVRGLFIPLNFAYAQYPTVSATADLLYPLVWDVVRSLECADFKVIGVTCDKASANRRFIQLHNISGSKPALVYKIKNPFSKDERFIFFISDVPHLIKTVRNAWSNSFGHSHKRALWVRYYNLKMKLFSLLYPPPPPPPIRSMTNI